MCEYIFVKTSQWKTTNINFDMIFILISTACDLTHCILVNSFAVIYWASPFVILGQSSLFCILFYFRWKILLASNVGPDQKPHYVASDLGLHCLPMTILWVSR